MKDEEIATLFLLILGASALAEALNPKCPVCKNQVDRGAIRCPHCGAPLRWGP